MNSTPDLANPAGAIFDCDGTLLDSMGLWIEMEDDLAVRAGYTLSQEQKDVLRGYTIQETSRFYHEVAGLGSSPEDVESMILDYAVDFYKTKAKPRPGALEFVTGLVEAGVRCSVVSSSPHAMLDPGLAANGFTDLLDIVVSTDDAGASKRTSVPFDMARDAMGCTTGETWVFEDSAYAVESAKRAGYKTVAIWDRDESGTVEELQNLADITVTAWKDLSIDKFLSGGYR